ncbi:MAG: hypothetical protein GC145_05250 [Caulobacter sp.]|nr:hypothetical protein [Caulobacter sp.]
MHRHGKAALVTIGLLLLGACASTAPSDGMELFSGGRVSSAEVARRARAAAAHPLGSEANPVRVNMPAGQQAYLRRLRCSDGRPPVFERSGNLGPGLYGSIVDAYDVRCPGASPARSVIIMDMYHPDHYETGAPPGFTIEN